MWSYICRIGSITFSLAIDCLIFSGLQPNGVHAESLPEPDSDIRFEISFSRVSRSPAERPVVFKRAFTLHGGPVEGEMLLPGMRVVPDSGGRYFYGNEWSATYRIDSQEQIFNEMEPKDWPMGVTYDSKRDRVMIATLGGEGFLYSYNPADRSLTEVASMQNKDVDCLEYHPATDTFYAVEHSGTQGVILKYSPEGELLGQISFGSIPASINPHGYRVELISIPDALVLLMEPIYPRADVPNESRMYRIDPVAGTYEMTYRKVWDAWPPEDSPTSVRIVQPAPGVSLLAGVPLLFQASASDYDDPIRSVSFSLNEQSIGQGQQNTLYDLSYTIAEPGEYSLTATAINYDGQSATSEPVKLTVTAKTAPFRVEMAGPADGTTLKFGTELELIAKAYADGVDTVAVEFYSNGQFIGAGVEWATLVATDEETFSLDWGTGAIGTHKITVKASASNGQTATSEPITITISPPDDDEPTTFWVSFANLGGSSDRPIVDREYSLTRGSLDGGRLIPGMRVVPDEEMLFYYGAERQEVYQINSQTGAKNSIAPPPGDDFSWPMGATYNKESDRAVVVTLGGEGFLYGYDSETGEWTLIATMENLDLDSIDYDPERNSYFGASSFLHKGSSAFIYELSAEGKQVQTIHIPNATPLTGPDYYTSETIDLRDGKVALFLEPELHFGQHPTGGESRIFLIDPVAKTATLTYARIWTSPNTPPSVLITTPQNGDSFELGSEVRIVANSRDADGQVTKVEFFVNGQSIGDGVEVPTDALIAHLTEKKWKPAAVGSYRLTAKATDNEGAVTVSEPVIVNIRESEPITFSVSFAQPSSEKTSVFTQRYTLEGGVVGGGPLIPGMRVVPDKQKIFYYGARSQEVYKINAASGVSTVIEPNGPGIPELSWPMGVAYNLHTDYVFLVSLGGEGFLYAYEPVQGTWSLITSMDNLDMESLEYDPETDGYFGTSAFLHRGYPLQVYQLSNEGNLLQTITIPDAVPETGPEYYTTETIDLPDGKVAVFVEPEFHFPDPIGGESKIYLIDPVAKTATLTYRRDLGIVNNPPHFEINSPENGDTFRLGTEISIFAGGRDRDGRIIKIEFFVNGRSIGEGVDQPTVALPGTRAALKRWTPAEAGDYILTVKATDDDGAVATTDPVNISVVGGFPEVTVEIIHPKNGAIFEPGQIIEISARATQGPHSVEAVEFHANDQLLGAGVRSLNDHAIFNFRFANASSGSIALTAKAFGVGDSSVSLPVRITVGSVPEMISAVRDLPEGYTPGTPLEVKIAVTPGDTVNVYAVEDSPPAGWVVTRVSHEGEFDPVTRKVKFGIFTDRQARVLGYLATPPENASGGASFSGQVAADGSTHAIRGDSTIQTAPFRHPADSSIEDNRITLNEVTAYASAWKEGDDWAGESIPLSYVTRAGILWKMGEAYYFNPDGAAPMCWVPTSFVVPPPGKDGVYLAHNVTSGTIRAISRAAGGVHVQITVQPPAGSSNYAIEETVPAGWSLSTPDHGGVVMGNVLRWGPFYDALPRTFTYTTLPSEKSSGGFHGIVSFDGSSEVIQGQAWVGDGRPALQLSSSGANMLLKFSAPVPANAIIEAAATLDSDNWTAVGSVSAGNSEAAVAADGSAQRFFRLRFLE